MEATETPEEAVLRRMIRDAERAYNKIEKPTFHRVSMGNDPKQAGLDCTEFQPTERAELGNFCFDRYLVEMSQKANAEYGSNAPHSIHTKDS